MSEDEKPQEQRSKELWVWPPPDPNHVAILKSGVGNWNAWRKEHPETQPRLGDADLQSADLFAADLRNAVMLGANLEMAQLHKANLEGAALPSTRLRGANLWKANIQKADLLAATLQDACLTQAELQFADLRRVKLDGATLEGADISGANLSGARVEGTCFHNVRWRAEGGGLPDPHLYENFDVRGLRNSDPLFDQFVRQAEFIRRTKEAMSGTRRGRVLFRLWKLTCDCGRSIGRWLLTCGLVIVFFTVLFNVFEFLFKYPLVSLTKRATTPLTSLYFSMVTFSTLGFGDVTPCNWLGELAVMVEVFLGYVLLGGLITILAMKLVPPR